jgi:predicted dehydrogenase
MAPWARYRWRRGRAIDGAVGALRMVQFQEEAPFRPTGWRNRRALNEGGVFMDSGIHTVDLLLYLVGTPVQLSAVALPPGLPGLEAEDGVVVTTRSARGVVGLITHVWTNAHPPPAPWVAVGAPWKRPFALLILSGLPSFFGT